MRKIFVGFSILVCFSSCQYVNSAVETLKSSLKSSLEVRNILPSVSLGQNDGSKKEKDSVNHFTLSHFFAEKFYL